MTETKIDYEAKVGEICPDILYVASFVPWSISRNAGEKTASLNWKITISVGRQSITTDYMQGIDHLPKAGRWAGWGNKSIDQDAAEKNAAERGEFPAGRRLKPPSLAEVLSCLLLDSGAIDHPDYLSWAADLGYDPDSRKGEAVYKACLEIGLKLRSMLSETKMEQLREALRDM